MSWIMLSIMQMSVYKFLCVIGVLFLFAFLVFRYYIVENVVKKQGELINFATFKKPNTPNFYISCPTAYCPQIISKGTTPTYNLSVETLIQRWNIMIKKQPRIELITKSTEKRQHVYVQYSWFFHFPDFIYVQFIPLNQSQSSIAIYSQSYFGYSDLGVNKKRVDHLLRKLSKQ